MVPPPPRSPLFPYTTLFRSATIGGFVGGGSGGIGSINYGGLREPGNILCARVVTVEEAPRVIELRTDAAQKVNRARSEEHTSELQSNVKFVCRLLLEKKKDP